MCSSLTVTRSLIIIFFSLTTHQTDLFPGRIDTIMYSLHYVKQAYIFVYIIIIIELPILYLPFKGTISS